MSESITAKEEEKNRQKPPLSLGRIASEILAGIGMSFAAMMLFRCIEGLMLFGGIGDGESRIAFMATLSKVTPGVCGIAGAVGVYLLGSRGSQTGSFLVTLASGFLAGLLMLATRPLAYRLPEALLIVTLFCSFLPPVLLVSPIMATIGFNLTRRYKETVLPRTSGE
ncbi:MAG: hypothetical protein JSU70_09575 [Phycisphaerales bacterium]|nr:MAG: hypothetical protein JSU70_09575 [Phycisphaerales bacterium]